MEPLPTRIDGPLAVIGDVHGQTDKLWRILERLQTLPDFPDRWVVFIGDFVDRGPDPRGAVETALQVRRAHPRTTAIMGNHELAMLGALRLIEVPEYSNWDKRWLDHYDAEPTFASYGVDFADLPGLREALPASHADFLAGLPWAVEHPQYLFVHAGLEPHTPFGMQLQILRARDFTLNRPYWLCSKSVDDQPPPDCPVTVVSGHVYVPEVVFADRRILLDTSGGMGGELSCVLLPEQVVLTSSGSVVPAARPARAQKRRWWKLW